MNDFQSLTGSRVPFSEFDIVLVRDTPNYFAEVSEVDVVTNFSQAEVYLSGKPKVLIQGISAGGRAIPTPYLYPSKSRRAITRDDIIGVCCPQCWHSNRYQSDEDTFMVGIVTPGGMYRVCERCNYYKKVNG